MAQGAAFTDCIAIADWNTKTIDDDVSVVSRTANGCCPIGTVPGVQYTDFYDGAQVVCGFQSDGTLQLNLNTILGCDYEQCYVHKQNLACADGTKQRLNGCCAGSASGSGDATDVARLAFEDDSCTGTTMALPTVHSLFDFFEYCTTYRSDYATCNEAEELAGASQGTACQGTATRGDDISGTSSGTSVTTSDGTTLNVGNLGRYKGCEGGGGLDSDMDSSADRVGLSVFMLGIFASLAL